jgi:hypothetical protein
VPKDTELLDSLGVSWHDSVSEDEWRHVGFGTEVRMLFKRELVHTTRNKKGVGARFFLTTFMSLLVGNIFFGVGASDNTDPSVRFTLAFFSLGITSFSLFCPSLV